jgi:hypothetical protein
MLQNGEASLRPLPEWLQPFLYGVVVLENSWNLGGPALAL